MNVIPIALSVNGAGVRSETDVRTLLLDFLRDELGLTGAHRGCDTNQCGACAIELDGRAAKACSLLAAQAHGSSITTIEGVGPPGHLDDLQQAFSRLHALQCGYCTPGMVMAAREILRNTPSPAEAEVREALHGNICRCTGYQGIVDAILQAARARQEAK